MKFFFVSLLLAPLLTFGQVTFEDAPLNEIVAKGFSERKNVLIVFENSWSPLCKQFKREVFGDGGFDTLLAENFITRNVVSSISEEKGVLAYDATPDGDVAKLFKLDAFPTIVILHPTSDSAYSVTARLIGVKSQLNQVALGGDDSFLVVESSGKTVFDANYATAMIRRYVWPK